MTLFFIRLTYYPPVNKKKQFMHYYYYYCTTLGYYYHTRAELSSLNLPLFVKLYLPIRATKCSGHFSNNQLMATE